MSNSEMLDMESLPMKLRQAFVEELIGEHHGMYEEFVTEGEEYDYQSEAKNSLTTDISTAPLETLCLWQWPQFCRHP